MTPVREDGLDMVNSSIKDGFLLNVTFVNLKSKSFKMAANKLTKIA